MQAISSVETPYNQLPDLSKSFLCFLCFLLLHLIKCFLCFLCFLLLHLSKCFLCFFCFLLVRKCFLCFLCFLLLSKGFLCFFSPSWLSVCLCSPSMAWLSNLSPPSHLPRPAIREGSFCAGSHGETRISRGQQQQAGWLRKHLQAGRPNEGQPLESMGVNRGLAR